MARRLAEANLDRAEALQERENARTQAEQQDKDEPFSLAHDSYFPPRPTESSGIVSETTTPIVTEKRLNPYLEYFDREEQFLWKLKVEEELH